MPQPLTQAEIDDALCLALATDRRAIVELKAESAALRATAGDLLTILEKHKALISDDDEKTILNAMYQIGVLSDPLQPDPLQFYEQKEDA